MEPRPALVGSCAVNMVWELSPGVPEIMRRFLRAPSGPEPSSDFVRSMISCDGWLFRRTPWLRALNGVCLDGPACAVKCAGCGIVGETYEVGLWNIGMEGVVGLL